MFKINDYVKLTSKIYLGYCEDIEEGTEGYINEVDNGLLLFQPIHSDVDEYWINENDCILIERE